MDINTLFAAFLILASIWLVERIVAKAFKTALAIIAILLILTVCSFSDKTLPKFSSEDIENFDSFKKKANVYKERVIKDVQSYIK